MCLHSPYDAWREKKHEEKRKHEHKKTGQEKHKEHKKTKQEKHKEHKKTKQEKRKKKNQEKHVREETTPVRFVVAVSETLTSVSAAPAFLWSFSLFSFSLLLRVEKREREDAFLTLVCWVSYAGERCWERIEEKGALGSHCVFRHHYSGH